MNESDCERRYNNWYAKNEGTCASIVLLSVFGVLHATYFLNLAMPVLITKPIAIEEASFNLIVFLIVIVYAASVLTLLSLCRLHTVKLSNLKPYVNDGNAVDPNDVCWHCKKYRRPDVRHCGTCGTCVEGYDHHCGVVGICIGDKNFKFFVLFIAYSGIFIGMMGLSSFVYRRSTLKAEGKTDRNLDGSISFVFALFGGLVMLSLVATAVSFFKMAIKPVRRKDERDYNERQKNESDKYDRTTHASNIKRICGGYNLLRWILPI